MSSPPNSIAPSSALQALIQAAQRHYAVGNTVVAIVTSRAGADPDLGIAGAATEARVPIDPEPSMGAVAVNTVLNSGGALRYSDLRMSIVKDALSETIVTSHALTFEVNGVRYDIVAYTPLQNMWEFVIRRS